MPPVQHRNREQINEADGHRQGRHQGDQGERLEPGDIAGNFGNSNGSGQLVARLRTGQNALQIGQVGDNDRTGLAYPVPDGRKRVVLDVLGPASGYPQLADPLAAAKIRELIQFIELHLELVARELYKEAFFGGKVSDDLKNNVRKLLTRNAAALGKLVKFSPYLAGATFTMADCAGAVHLPIVSMASKAIYGEDVLAAYQVRDYLKLLGERVTVQKINEDRKANMVEMLKLRAPK